MSTNNNYFKVHWLGAKGGGELFLFDDRSANSVRQAKKKANAKLLELELLGHETLLSVYRRCSVYRRHPVAWGVTKHVVGQTMPKSHHKKWSREPH